MYLADSDLGQFVFTTFFIGIISVRKILQYNFRAQIVTAVKLMKISFFFRRFYLLLSPALLQHADM